MKKGELEAQRGGRQAAGARKKRNPIEDLKREVAIMRTLRHKNITALQEVVDDPSGNKVRSMQRYCRSRVKAIRFGFMPFLIPAAGLDVGLHGSSLGGQPPSGLVHAVPAWCGRL